MEIQQGIKEFLIEIEVRKYTPRTIRGYRNNLNLFLRFCTEHEITGIENVTLATVKQFTRAMTASKKKGGIHQWHFERRKILFAVLL